MEKPVRSIPRWAIGVPLIATCALLAGLFWLVEKDDAPPGLDASGDLRIAAASDLRFVLEAFRSELKAQNEGEELVFIYGSSGVLTAQVLQNAPFDVFLSADTEYPSQILVRGAAKAEDCFIYAVGHLTVWVPNDSPLDPFQHGLASLKDAKRIAVANPTFAPYGRMAELALRSANLFDTLQHKLVRAESVAHAAQYALSGATEAGLLSLSLARSPQMENAGKLWQVPNDVAPPMLQAGVILARGKKRATAEAFRDALIGPLGQSILSRNGFSIPESPLWTGKPSK